MTPEEEELVYNDLVIACNDRKKLNPSINSFNATGVPRWEFSTNLHGTYYNYERECNERYYPRYDGSEVYNRSYHYFPPYDIRYNPLTHAIYRKYINNTNRDSKLDKRYIYKKLPGEHEFVKVDNVENKGGGRRTYKKRRTHRRKSHRKSRSHRKRR